MVIIGGEMMDRFVHSTPNYLYEAAACIAEQNCDDEKSIIENHSKYGITKDEMTKYLDKFSKYKAAVLSEILPIYSKFPSLEPFFQPTDLRSDTNSSLALSLVIYLGKNLDSPLSDDEIDIIMNKFIISTIDDLSLDIDENEVEVKNLEDVLILLNKIKLEDSIKIQLINLYHNRYEIIKQLAELLHLCAPICEKYFYLSKDDFEKAQSFLLEKDNMEKLLEALGLKVNIPQNAEIYFSIAIFNSISLAEIHNGFVFYIGIYFFDIFDLKSKNRFNDTQIVTDLKALGDPTRLKMIHLLALRKMYIQELAQNLELTPATVSHHINILLKSELISLTVDGISSRKIYYETNSEKLERLGETIKSLGKNNLLGGNIFGE
jgi:DNA-binding transcriptional ArsR family regulator